MATYQVPFQDANQIAGFITLTMSLYEWAHYTTRKGAVKMHTLLDYDSLLPEFVNITD